MKNFIKLIGIVALVAAIGFAFVSCEEDQKGGTLTITGLSAYNGKYAAAQGATAGGDPIIAGESISKPGKISGGKATLNVYTQKGDFTGSGAATLAVVIFDSENTDAGPIATGSLTVTFKDGSAEGAVKIDSED